MQIKSKPIRLLIIAFSDSIHTARWISQLDREIYDIWLLPSVPFKDIHPLITSVTIFQLQKSSDENMNNFVITHKFYRVLEFIFGKKFSKIFTTRFLLKGMQQRLLRKAICKITPSIVHTMETQQAGYLMSDMRSRVGNFQWIHSTWGIDLHYFQDFADHKQKLIKLFSKLDTLIAEGNRDVQFAKSLGFRGFSSIIPSVGGGMDFELLDSLDFKAVPSGRKFVILKGYDGDGRLAGIALNALRKIRHLLNGFEVIVYSCSRRLYPVINEIQNNMEFVLHFREEISYKELLKLTASSRISITNNMSDGVPNTMLEAMALGSFPIQSNTAITQEWITDGFNGLLTQPDNELHISQCMAKALTDDSLVDKAADYNRNLVRQKLNRQKIIGMVNEIYAFSN